MNIDQYVHEYGSISDDKWAVVLDDGYMAKPLRTPMVFQFADTDA